MLFQRDSAGHQKNQEITKNIGKPVVVCGEAAEIPLAVSNCGECFQIAGVIYQCVIQCLGFFDSFVIYLGLKGVPIQSLVNALAF